MSDPTAGGRRAEARRQRRRRQRLVLAGLVAVAVVALAVVTYGLTRSDRTPHASLTAPKRTQSTVLLQVRGEDGSALGNALLAHDPAAATGAVVLVPPQLIVTVPGKGTLQLGPALKTVTPAGSRSALSDLVGVTVDAGWVLDASGLAALVDQVGGIPVDVDVPVVVNRSVVLSPGSQRVSGAQAQQLLGYLAPGEQEQSRLARLQEVLDGLLTALPAQAQLETSLSGLGPQSQPSAPVAELAGFLEGLAGDSRKDALQYDTLPVVPIDPGNGVTSFRIDADATRALVDRLLAQSVPKGARQSGNRVLVLNGVGTPGLGEKVRAKLVPAGFVFVGSRNNASFGVARTRVLVREATTEQQALGARVAKALGVGEDAVQTADLGSLADVVVVVGADFKPGT